MTASDSGLVPNPGETLALHPEGHRLVVYYEAGELRSAIYCRGAFVRPHPDGGWATVDFNGRSSRLSQRELDGLAEILPTAAQPPLMTDQAELPADVTAARTENGQERPRLDPAALYGPIGDYVMAAAPYTEADPAAILATGLALAGCCIGRHPYLLAGNDRHSTNLFVCVVGSTARGGKGTSWAVARSPLEIADDYFMTRRVNGGFGSGEAVIQAVADPTDGDDTTPNDYRLLWHEPEFARILKVAARDGSTLSPILREAWDGHGRLQSRTVTRSKVVATTHHIAVVAHITAEELRARLSDVETFGGTANRFLFVYSRRSKLLPSGGNVPAEIIKAHGSILAERIESGRRHGLMSRTPDAEKLWEHLYRRLDEDEPGGLLGAVIARDAPQILRVSLLYALLDNAEAIDVPHLEAAWALRSYWRASAEFIFGDALGDEVADRLLAAVRHAGTEGLDGTAQQRLFGRHVPAKRLQAARELLAARGQILTVTEQTGGRPRVISYPTSAVAKKAN